MLTRDTTAKGHPTTAAAAACRAAVVGIVPGPSGAVAPWRGAGLDTRRLGQTGFSECSNRAAGAAIGRWRAEPGAAAEASGSASRGTLGCPRMGRGQRL